MPRNSLARPASALALLTGFPALTGCVGPEPAPPPIDTPIAALKSDEQALAVGSEAYQNYLDIWNEVVVEAGNDAARIDEVTTGKLQQFENESLTKLQELGWFFSGAAVLEVFTVTDWYSTPDAAGVLIVGSACVDMTGLQALDASGDSVVRPERPSRRTWEVHIAEGTEAQRPFVLSKHEVLREGSTCGE